MKAVRKYGRSNSSRTGGADLAEPELRRALAQDPGDPELHAFLALTLCDLNRPSDALPEAEQSIGLAPDVGLGHYARAVALLDLGRTKDSEGAAREALHLNPLDIAARVTLAAALLDRGKREEALAMTEEALRFDPENTAAANLRAHVLVKLGRRDEAADAVDGVLSRDPESAVTHANRGMDAAAPEPAAARDGVVSGGAEVGARQRLGAVWHRGGYEGAQPGLPCAARLLPLDEPTQRRTAVGRHHRRLPRRSSDSRRDGGLPPARDPDVGGQLVLQPHPVLDPFGRLVLSRDERVGAALMGVCVFGGLALGVGGLLANSLDAAVIGAGLFSLSLPVGGTFVKPAGRRLIASVYTASLALVLVAFSVLRVSDVDGVADTLGTTYIVGLVAFTWLANVFRR